MRLIFIGPPGSGKGTQANLLSQRLGLLHYATGDVLRDAVRQNTPEGKLAQPFVVNGKLVPDDVVNTIVNSRFQSSDRPSKFVMDGYPRTIAQANSFDTVLHANLLDLDAVIFLAVADEEIIRRTGSRWSCPNHQCKAIYNLQSKQPKKTGICDLCGTAILQREDDKPETVAKRLKIFHEQMDGLLDHYRKKGLLIEVPGIGDIETIFSGIRNSLEKKNKPSAAKAGKN